MPNSPNRPNGSSKDPILGLPERSAERSPPATFDVEVALRRHFEGVEIEDWCAESDVWVAGGPVVKIVRGPSSGAISVKFSGELTHLIQEFCSRISRQHLEDIVRKISNERLLESVTELECGPVVTPVVSSRKYDETLWNMVMRVREFAVDPRGVFTSSTVEDLCKCLNMVLTTRRVLSQRIDCALNVEELLHEESLRVGQSLHGNPSASSDVDLRKSYTKSIRRRVSSHSVSLDLDQFNSAGTHRPLRRSPRLQEIVHCQTKHEPVDSCLQADIPKWTDSSSTTLDSEHNKSLILPDLVTKLECGSMVTPAALRRKYNKTTLEDVVKCVRAFAIDPSGIIASTTVQDLCECLNMVLKTRRILSRNVDCDLDVEVLPYQEGQHQSLHRKRSISSGLDLRKLNMKRRRRHISSSDLDECDSDIIELETVPQPMRRSPRLDCPIKDVPVGSCFQADIPEWMGTNEKCLLDLKWLGTRIWPIENINGNSMEPIIGKGRGDPCLCIFPKSVGCIRYHIRMAKFELRSKLGQAFFSMGFDEMGEDVSCTWSWDDQMAFHMLVQSNPISEDKTFWPHASKCFSSRSRKELVSYYFNVHVLRRMCMQTRLELEKKVDSDDDECIGNPYQLLPGCSHVRNLAEENATVRDDVCSNLRKTQDLSQISRQV